MKKILFLLLLVASASTAQTIKQSKAEAAKILCRKWTVDYVNFKGTRVPMTVPITIEFKANNTCVATINGEKKTGKWTHDTKTKSISFKMKSEVQILSLSEKEFTFGEVAATSRDTPEGAIFHAIRMK